MSDYVIYKDQDRLDSNGPTAHAIVIGVGRYCYLQGGGTGKVAKYDGGLPQLSSPPESARTFARWLLDKFNNPNKPLATVSMLISETNGPTKFNHDRLATEITLKEATIENVEEATEEWYDLGDRNEDNLLLFFFCGHGVARGLEGLTLLLADYGKKDKKPMDGAIDFAAMHRGMAQCKASEQIYFIDACRMVSNIATRTTATGNAIIQDDKNRPYNSPLNSAVFYSTLGGKKAYGEENKPSFFTQELIKGLNGTGSNNRGADGKWRVSTGDLSFAIHHGLSLRGERVMVPMTNLVHFEFHELKQDPKALAIVYCDPRSDNKYATFICEQGNNEIDSRQPAEDNWELLVPWGFYDFSAKINKRLGKEPNVMVFPPYQNIKIGVPP